jgi:hypothetical protein
LEVFGLFVLLALGWFWLDSLRTRDRAIEAVRAACAAESLQLLDDTVSQQQLRLERDPEGYLRFRRLYRFDYSDTGDNRRRGSVLLLGQRVVELHLKPRLIPSDRVLH